MDTEIHRKLRTLLRVAVLLGAALVGGLVSVVWENPTDVRAWTGAVIAFATGMLVGQAYRLVRRTAVGSPVP